MASAAFSSKYSTAFEAPDHDRTEKRSRDSLACPPSNLLDYHMVESNTPTFMKDMLPGMVPRELPETLKNASRVPVTWTHIEAALYQ